MNKNLLELCLSPDLGGLELYMVRSAKALHDSMNVISVIGVTTKLEQYYENTQFKYEKIQRKRSFSFSAARKLSKIIDENDIDIIHMHWTKDLPIAVMAKVLSKKKPKLAQTRNMTMTRFKDDFYHRFLYKHMDIILAVTQQVSEQVKKFIPEDIRPQVEVLYMGSDKPIILNEEEIQAYRKEIGVKENEFLIGMVGRIEKGKGQYLLLEAIEKLKSKTISIKVCFVGHAMEESYQNELDLLLKKKKLEDKVSFLGFTKNPHRFMQACDVLVLATPCETFGLVVIEAMQVGTAVIATKACGPLEIIEDEKTGLLFEVANSKDLAEKIYSLVANKDLCLAISQDGQKVAIKKFSNHEQFKRLKQILKSLG
ncbi:MAG: glycosyl transferase [Arcobacter sp.]|nr:MAG: glycosyl transferase [Arcobacter sp.]